MEYEDCHILRSIGIPKDRIHRTAVVCGSVYRLQKFAEHGTNYFEYKEFLCYKAAEVEVDGQMILLVCHGVSSTSAGPILRELMEMGVKVVIRAGTCGTYKPFLVNHCDLFVPYACVVDESCSPSEVDIRYPSVADYDVVDCIVDIANNLDLKVHLGIGYTCDFFYHTTFKPDHRDLFAHKGIADVEDLEMSLVFVMASLYGAKAGAILTVDGSPLEWGRGKYHQHSDSFNESIQRMNLLAIKAASVLNKKYCAK